MDVLIVDDEPINVLLLESLLEGKYQTRVAANGQIAYNMIEEQSPDIVLLDVIMPVMDGFTALKKIKKNKQLDHLIVIMVTAKVSKEDVKEAMLIGADDYIKKPIDATELYTKIDIHVKLRQQAQQLHNYRVYANIHESMITAQRIQSSLLPDKQMFNKLFPDSFTLYKPRDMVGGDLYFVSQNSNKKFISVSDNTGHGVPAAMLSMLTYMSLNYIVNKLNITKPADVAKILLDELTDNLSKSADTFVSLFDVDAIFCEFDCENNIFTFSNVGRPMVIVRQNIDYIIVDGEKTMPAMSKDNSHLFYIRGDLVLFGKLCTEKVEFRNSEIQLMPGDMIYLYSDGITDQFGGIRDKKYSKKRFLNLLLDIQNQPLNEQKLHIYQEIERWTINLQQTDDIVVIGIKA